MGRAELAGSARLELVSGVVQLRPEDAMLEAMLRGWRAQQAARGLREDTIVPRERLVRRFGEFTGEYPWEWSPGAHGRVVAAPDRRGAPGALDDPRLPGHAAAVHRVPRPTPGTGGRRRARRSSVRGSIRWRSAMSGTRSRTSTTTRAIPRRGRSPARRCSGSWTTPTSRWTGRCTARRKGALAAYRDATLFKVIYGWGLFSGVRLLREGLASRVCAAQRLLTERLSAAAVVVQGPARRVIGAGSCG